jgi:RNA polymerase sigma-70 factor (ECF subfamily)
VYSVAFKVLDNEAEAEEVLQQVFVDVWDKAGSYDPDRSARFVWLMCIARELAIGRLRSRMIPIGQTGKRSDVVGENENGCREARPDDAALHSAEYPGFADALTHLTHEQRSLIEHAYFRGRTQSELAECFDLPLESVKNLIRSGMFALRIALEPSTARMHSLYLEELVALNSLGALDGADVIEFKRIVPNVAQMPNEIAIYEYVAALFAIAYAQERIPHPAAKEKLLSRIR